MALIDVAALFFVTYEAIKRLLGASADGSSQSPFIFMTAATCGEIVSDMQLSDQGKCQ